MLLTMEILRHVMQVGSQPFKQRARKKIVKGVDSTAPHPPASKGCSLVSRDFRLQILSPLVGKIEEFKNINCMTYCPWHWKLHFVQHLRYTSWCTLLRCDFISDTLGNDSVHRVQIVLLCWLYTCLFIWKVVLYISMISYNTYYFMMYQTPNRDLALQQWCYLCIVALMCTTVHLWQTPYPNNCPLHLHWTESLNYTCTCNLFWKLWLLWKVIYEMITLCLVNICSKIFKHLKISWPLMQKMWQNLQKWSISLLILPYTLLNIHFFWQMEEDISQFIR